MERTSLKKQPEIIDTRRADENNVVVTIKNGGNAYREKPCPECPWRKENDGSFPAEAFRHSARTAYDMSQHTFACHMASLDHPVICAGSILASCDNMSLRLMEINDQLDRDRVTDAGADLHNNYRAMAEANGVSADDPILGPCR